MEVLDRALFRHVSGAGSTEPVQKPISSTIKDGVQVDKFDLGNGGIAIVTCTGVTVSLSLGLQGRKLIDLNGGFGTTVTSCKITTIDKDGQIIERGKHEELLAREGFYYDLYMSQFKKQEEMEAVSVQ